MELDECTGCGYLIKLKRGRIFKNERETKSRKYKCWCSYEKELDKSSEEDFYIKTVQIPIGRLINCPLE